MLHVERETPVRAIDNLLISAGAMKAGTTWLYLMLRSHPQIVVTPIKETHFFAQGYTHWDILSAQDRLDRFREHFAGTTLETGMGAVVDDLAWFKRFLPGPVDARWFANLFPDRSPDNYCADFSNWTALVRNQGWRRMRVTAEKLRVIYTIRNPTERYWSHLKFFLQMCDPTRGIDDLSASDITTMLGGDDFRAHGEYSSFIANARAHLAEDELMVFHFEEFREDPLAALRKLEGFLGIRENYYDPFMLYGAVNVTEKRPFTRAFLDACRSRVEDEVEQLDRLGVPVPDSYRWRNNDQVAEPGRNRLSVPGRLTAPA